MGEEALDPNCRGGNAFAPGASSEDNRGGEDHISRLAAELRHLILGRLKVSGSPVKELTPIDQACLSSHRGYVLLFAWLPHLVQKTFRGLSGCKDDEKAG
jgi:hypothetical protein